MGGRFQNPQKTLYYKTLLETYLVKNLKVNGIYQDYSYECLQSNKLSHFSTKTYVVGTQKNCRNETVLLNTTYRLNLMCKKILTILRSTFVLI